MGTLVGIEVEKVPDSEKPGGKNMLAESAQKLFTVESHDFLLVVAVVVPSECNTLVSNA